MDSFERLKDGIRECLAEMISLDNMPVEATEHLINKAWNEVLDEVLKYKKPHLKIVSAED